VWISKRLPNEFGREVDRKSESLIGSGSISSDRPTSERPRQERRSATARYEIALICTACRVMTLLRSYHRLQAGSEMALYRFFAYQATGPRAGHGQLKEAPDRTTKHAHLQASLRDGSDGTRTRDLRRDRSVLVVPGSPGIGGDYRREQVFSAMGLRG
jgi:hypothetical protein